MLVPLGSRMRTLGTVPVGMVTLNMVLHRPLHLMSLVIALVMRGMFYLLVIPMVALRPRLQ